MNIYRFYVYAYLREDGTPYYIGKGQGDRAYSKSNKHRIGVPKDAQKIVFLEKNLSEIGALAIERRYILWYGRKDIHTGILRNMTDGGDGLSGAKLSQETRQKMSSSQMGRRHTPETKQKLSIIHKNRSPETRQKMLIASHLRKHDEETKQKISSISRNRSPETRQKMSESAKNRLPNRLGKKHTPEAKQKISDAKRKSLTTTRL